jgi:hypothetical protein
MTSIAANAPPPSAREIADLKRLAAGIIRAQGNRFIKELLRDKKIRMGANKQDFNRNLDAAIESGNLRLDDVDRWLRRVEGWGNQHVYLYRISDALRATLTESRILENVASARLKKVWNGKTLLQFPEEPQLTSISFSDSVLRLVWQESSPGWTPESDKNYTEEEGLDTYEYRAYRKIEWRAITRFEAHLDKGIAALFIANPIEGEEHKKAIAEVKRVLAKLLDLPALEKEILDIRSVSKNMDQRNVPNNLVPIPEIKAQKSRLGSGGSYVEFAATAADKAYWEEKAVQGVRLSIKKDQLAPFDGAEGVFIFQKCDGGLTRPLRVQLYRGNRVRLWAEMDAVEVWTILAKLNTYL